ncbi:hypothetical protein Misp01_24810 [Microtetraspora sp. NBRC 13810]|uniref:C40 family peptidase n=1 Tax=Microtetraspora sp. NBRC 13810 TaxID=3030990 RepID=UPI0024A59ABE|nr:C40 family peptidase [Microtetraspora sp. NBRC 13810]GLW07351.1 hypothetical protein Misp01_24810 [Microtetraspora sp. NBRC 13810]
MLDERARAQDPRQQPYYAYYAQLQPPPVDGHRTRRRQRRIRLLRRAVPVIAGVLVAVVTADLMVLNELSRRGSAAAGPPAEVAPQRMSGGYVAATEPVPSASPQVAELGKLRAPHLFAVARQPLTNETLVKVGKVAGIKAVEIADAAEVTIDGKQVQTLGVDPSTFRAYTPKPTARSDGLWRNVASGDMVVSFVLGNDGGLALGRTVPAGGGTLRVGGYATMGMGSIDAVVSRQTGRSLGMPQNNALVISAPGTDSAKVRAALLKALPKGSQVATINPVLVAPRGGTGQNQSQSQSQGQSTQGRQNQAPPPQQQQQNWPTGSLMSVPQVEAMLRAAASKIGRPYVWGAEGPDSFDCSGLVQWAFAQAGVKMPRVTHQQFVTGPQVSLDQAQPGDLIFWRNDPTNPGYISHVAIYWGDGKMLNAPRTGDVVKIAPVYTKNLAGVVRVSPQVAQSVR